MSSQEMVVTANYGSHAIAVRTTHIANPSEWLIGEPVAPTQEPEATGDTDYIPDYTHMKATGKAIEMCAELEAICHLPCSFRIMFGGKVRTIIVQDDE